MPFPQLHPALEMALAGQGYAEPTPVQAQVLAEGSAEQDLLVSAQTGSGKTVAYGLAMASTLMGVAERLGQPSAPAALVVAPTRELAIQVAGELTWLYAGAGGVVTSCVGGMDPRREQRALAAGAHIVVGTPGRLRDHLERNHLDLSALDVVVLDEADEMLDLGFREDLEFLLDAAPAERRTLLFSATIAKEIANLARRYQRSAVRIDTGSKGEPHGDIEYRAIRVAPNEVEHAVVNVLRHIEAPGALVFCATREAVRHLHANLRERGFAVVALSGELTQKERADALQSLRDGRARVCVATDVAARGLDLPDLGLVMHADLPTNKAGLLHRSGRTGRAGRKGTSVLLVPYTRRRQAEGLLASARIDAVWSAPPTADEIRAKDQLRLMQDPILSEPPTEEDTALAQAVIGTSSAEAIAVALIRLHRSRLPAPEELYDETSRDRPEQSHGRNDGPPPRREREPIGESTWFRLKVGRFNDADPKWLIPLICRLGHVTKKDIGQIRIFERETKFEISREMQARFMDAIRAHPDDKVQIEPSSDPGPKEGRGAPPKGGKRGPGGYGKGPRASNDSAPAFRADDNAQIELAPDPDLKEGRGAPPRDAKRGPGGYGKGPRSSNDGAPSFRPEDKVQTESAPYPGQTEGRGAPPKGAKRSPGGYRKGPRPSNDGAPPFRGPPRGKPNKGGHR
ncbi:MAG: DEAD/DEAH box helicase [Caulobacteraceae bacterium]